MGKFWNHIGSIDPLLGALMNKGMGAQLLRGALPAGTDDQQKEDLMDAAEARKKKHADSTMAPIEELATKMKKGGSVKSKGRGKSSASGRADGAAKRGKTRGRVV